jgi:hypothetical protein
MNPASPHDVPHEFLTFQTPAASVPTKSTAWLMLAAQLLKTPDLYGDQFVASTVIESGLAVIPLVSPLQPATERTLLMWNSPPCFVQD